MSNIFYKINCYLYTNYDPPIYISSEDPLCISRIRIKLVPQIIIWFLINISFLTCLKINSWFYIPIPLNFLLSYCFHLPGLSPKTLDSSLILSQPLSSLSKIISVLLSKYFQNPPISQYLHCCLSKSGPKHFNPGFLLSGLPASTYIALGPRLSRAL